MSAPSFAPPPVAAPRWIGDYQVVCRLAAGGMAEVFLAARHGVHDFARAVVVKRMLPHLAAEAELSGSILDEARILSRLRHPNVVHVEELGSDGTTYYLVLEYLRGDSVSSLLRRLRARGERLEPALAAHIVSEACAGLHAAHELCDDDGRQLGVVHRDISPHNVFVTFEGEVKVIDFGIARFDHHRAAARTRTGIAKGKFAYMAPEQFSGDPIDRRADVFALGAVLHELLTGERLFARDNDVQVLKAILNDPIAPPSDRCPAVPASLDTVCLRALARAPGDRYPTAEALGAALQELMPIVDPRHRARGELAGLVRRVLADRWAETEQQLRAARAPLASRPGPGAPCTDAPTASAVAAVPHPRSTLRPPARAPDGEPAPSISVVVEAPRRRDEPHEIVPATSRRAGRARTALALGSVLALGALGAVAMSLVSSATPPPPPSVAVVIEPPTVQHEPIPPPPRAPVSEPVPPATVQVRVETALPGAAVRRGDQLLGATPLDFEVARGTEPVELTIEREGYEPARVQVVPADDAILRVQLSRRPVRGDASRRRERRPRFYSFDAPQGATPTADPGAARPTPPREPPR